MAKTAETLWAIEEKAGGISFINVYKIQREAAKKMDTGYFQWCPVTGPEAMDTNETEEVPCEH